MTRYWCVSVGTSLTCATKVQIQHQDRVGQESQDLRLIEWLLGSYNITEAYYPVLNCLPGCHSYLDVTRDVSCKVAKLQTALRLT
jgi:hypothetical protein